MHLRESAVGSKQQVNPEQLLHRITNRIRQSLELDVMLSTTVDEVRSLLGTDRVLVYQFHPDEHGEVIAESVNEQKLPSLLGLHFPADDIPLNARDLFLSARQRTIIDVATQQIGVSRLDDATTEGAVKDDIRYRPVDPCHVAYLTAMGVQSSLAVPILHHQKLWGLMVSHCTEPRSYIEQDLQVLQLVVDQVCVAIAQATLLTQTRAQAHREATINRIATLLHASPTLQLQEALEEATAALQGSGGRLYCMAEAPNRSEMLYTYGRQPQLQRPDHRQAIEQQVLWQQLCQPGVGMSYKNSGLKALADLYQEPQLRVLASAFQTTQIRGLLVIPLEYHQKLLGYLTIFRDEIDTEITWAGQFNSDVRQLQPRNSFAVWRESKREQVISWTVEDLELAQALGSHFAFAVQQHALYQELHYLNASLELQVQERTAELKQSLELADVLRHVTDQIRSTLDSQTVLQTIAHEVQSLLNTDRIVVYQITDDGVGEIVVEVVGERWIAIKGKAYQDNCFLQEHSQRYIEGHVRAINNVQLSDLAECHKDFLTRMQVQANLVVSIRMGQQLWGLLIAHECRAPRHWLPSEIEILQQLANQAAIAIQQAELYEQSCTAAANATAQAQQLEQTATHLKQAMLELQSTQSQLIQHEKMSSLGQLVAGVAHEINNPVNFIYGNLTYAATYAQDLLNLISVYQEQYPQANAQVQTVAEAIELDFLKEDFPKILSSMRLGADRIQRIVQSLKNFSRLDEAEKKPVDIHEGIDNTLLILQHRLKPRGQYPGISIIKEYGELPAIECYAGQLNQVFMNILSNAIDALEERDRTRSLEEITAQPSQITIRTSLAQNLAGLRLVVWIADNGPGMAEETRAHLFDPFFTTKPIGQGTGLGLSISYQVVVDRHQGTLQCLSKPGEGAQFVLEIPIERNLSASH